MINDKYYKGYEGEPQIRFDSGTNELIVWEGYIYTLMEYMFDQNLKVLANYYSSDSNDNWEMKNLKNAITEFDLFDVNKIAKQEWRDIANDLSDVAKEIADFLKKAFTQNQKVYVAKD